MVLKGIFYRKIRDGHWMQCGDIPDIFNEILQDDSNDQIEISNRMLESAITQIQDAKPVQVERFLAKDIIIITVEYKDKSGFESKLLLWCRSENGFVRKGNVEYWNDVQRATNLTLRSFPR